MSKQKPGAKKIEVDVWSCPDLKAAIKDTIKAHVKDVELAKSLEKALSTFYAYKATSKHMLFEDT